MRKASKPALAADPARKQAVIYARVSSKEQEKEGFSIPAQLKLLKDYAASNGFLVAQEYVDVETAKQTGRAAFGEMVAYVKAHPSVRVMLVEKTDRLYRNLKDWVTVDELDVEMHFPKEAEQGFWPSNAPLGYRNVTREDGRKIIVPDEASAPIIRKIFEWYAWGDMSTQEVMKKARAAGLVFRKSGGRIPKSTVHAILRNRIYAGRFDWDGKTYQGRYEAIVPAELWDRVQDVLNGRNARRTKKGRRDFAFSGLFACHTCGCAVVGEIKKERYVYYHCTGYADKCQGNPASCRRRYVREEVLEKQFTEMLGRLKFDDEVLAWVRAALHASHADERREHEEAIKRHQAEYMRLNDRIHAMYVDKLDGLVEVAFFEKMSNQWREEQNRCQLRNRTASKRRQILSGRRNRAPRPRSERATAVRQARAARKTAPAQFSTIELQLEGRRSGCQFPTTL
jgi:hypothetical protein